MAADLEALSAGLSRFYNFSGKDVLYVGAGSRPLLHPAIRTRKRVIIDYDAAAIEQLRFTLEGAGQVSSWELIAQPFDQVSACGDVVYFEFCLHEMADPDRALSHARTLAREALVFDHAPGSPWSFLAAEDQLVQRSTAALERAGIRRRTALDAVQQFHDYPELAAKLAGQGELASARARQFAGAAGIVIPMPCCLYLIQ